MIIIIGIIVLIIVTILLGIKYFITAKKVLDETNFEREVIKSADRTIKKDRIITCDFCGSAIDTTKDEVCPNCGGAYSKDSEWIALRTVDEEKAKEESEKYKKRVKDKIKTKNQVTARRLKICIIALAAITVTLIGLAIFIDQWEGRPDYAISDNPEKELAYYDPAGYEIGEDAVLIDKNGIKVTIGGLYKSKSDSYEYKTEIVYENNSGQDARITVYCLGANGYLTADPSLLSYDTIAKGATITKYENLYLSSFLEEINAESIYSLSFGKISAHNNDYDLICERGGVVTLKTTLEGATIPAAPEGEPLYNDNGIRIVMDKSYRPYEDSEIKHILWIENNSENDYTLNADAVFNGEPMSVSGINRTNVAAGTVLRCEISSYEEAYEKASENDEFQLVISFESLTDPSQDFKTGYLKIKMSEETP